MSEPRMTIPEVRAALLEIADGMTSFAPATATLIKELVEQMKRRKPVRKTRAKLPKLTDNMLRAIRDYAGLHPDESQVEIALAIGTGPGRVSETLAGKRGE